MHFWAPGTQITWCYGDPGADFVSPMTVVRDDADALIAWLAVGTAVHRMIRADGRGLRAARDDAFTAPRQQIRAAWERFSVLRLYRPGDHWSLWHFFDGETGEFAGWYANLEAPHERSGLTTRSHDHVLDLVVGLDRVTHRKDADELDLAVEQGRFTPAEADQIRATATWVEQLAAAWERPFSDGWADFAPDPAWPIPPLP